MKTERIIPFALLISAALVSCQKENINSPTEPEKSIQKTITIADTPWTSDAETRSFYEEGVGVHLNKLENMSVYYWKYIANETEPTANTNILYTLLDEKNNITGATANTAGTWTFSHPVIEGADSYNYFFVIPHTSMNVLNQTKIGHSFRLASIQSPEILNKFKGCESSPLSFDPMMDCHIGQAQYGVGIATEMSDIHFKRIFTPLKLTVTDSKNVLEGAPVYTVTLKSNAVATQTQTLTGISYFKHSDKFEDAKLSSIDKASVGNGVSTIYQTPIAKSGDSYTTWFIVNPTKLPAGELLTVSVTTATKTITRTVNGTELDIKDNTINELSFDISGAGSTTEQSDYFYFKMERINELKNLVGSNTGAKPWTHSKCDLLRDVGNSQFNNALRIKTTQEKDKTTGEILSTTVGTVTYTAIPNKSLKRIRFYGHPRATTNPVTIEVKSGEEMIGTIPLSFNEIGKNGGYCELEIPAAHSASNLTFNIKGTNPAIISAATLFFNE